MPIPKKPLTKAAAALALAGGLAVPVGWALAPASAETPTTQTDDTTTDTAVDTGTGTDTDTTTDPTTTFAGDRATRRAERRAERQRLVAEKLGVTPEELKAARIAVLSDKLAENVASGRITQERADEILEAAENGTLPELRKQLRAERAAARDGG